MELAAASTIDGDDVDDVDEIFVQSSFEDHDDESGSADIEDDWLSDDTELIEVFEEYLMYDIIGLVATIGGTLGLFIGFSFYDKIIQFIKIFLDLVN